MKRLNSTLLLAIPLLALSCSSSHQVQSGKAIYCPGVQLETVSLAGDPLPGIEWTSVPTGEGYVNITNLQNGKKTKAHILMQKTTGTGAVVVSINKSAAVALGMMHTGLAPVEIRYSKRSL